MSKSSAPVPAPTFELPKPVLPCPTSPLQQTEGESWEHTRDMPSSYDRYRNDHITDRVDSENTEMGDNDD
jgi:hypothetical protein